MDGRTRAPGFPQRGQHAIHNAARTAFHQKNGRGLRLAAGEKIAHSFEYNVEFQVGRASKSPTLQGTPLPSRDREGAVILPNLASPSSVCGGLQPASARLPRTTGPAGGGLKETR